MGKAAHLEEAVLSVKSRADGETVFRVNFEWDESQGIPGAVLVRNLQHAKAHYCPSNENMDRIIPVITPHCVFSLIFFISSFVP